MSLTRHQLLKRQAIPLQLVGGASTAHIRVMWQAPEPKQQLFRAIVVNEGRFQSASILGFAVVSVSLEFPLEKLPGGLMSF